MYIYIITQYGNTVYKKFKFAQKNKPDKAFGDFRCQTSELKFIGAKCQKIIEDTIKANASLV